MEKFKTILKHPTRQTIIRMLNSYIINMVSSHINEYLMITKEVRNNPYELKFSPNTLPWYRAKEYDRENPPTIMQQISDLRQCCKFYKINLPLKDVDSFIKYCYQSGDHNVMKFAMMVDDTLLNISLLDENLAIRELAQTVKYHEHGKGKVKTF